ncbi:MAG: hypothetical protein EOP09_14120, partial [Proteobacteria bacterium]
MSQNLPTIEYIAPIIAPSPEQIEIMKAEAETYRPYLIMTYTKTTEPQPDGLSGYIPIEKRIDLISGLHWTDLALHIGEHATAGKFGNDDEEYQLGFALARTTHSGPRYMDVADIYSIDQSLGHLPYSEQLIKRLQ